MPGASPRFLASFGLALCVGLPDASEASVVEQTFVVTASRQPPANPTPAGSWPDPIDESPHSIAVVTEADIESRQPERVESLLQQQAGMLPSVGNAGLSSAVNARGFDIVSHLQYNGHPDIQRLYVRDLSTVERIEVIKGHFGVLYGQGAPGATVNYLGKRPRGTGTGRIALSVDGNGARRAELDLDGPARAGSSFGWRLVAATQAGDSWIDHVELDRHSLFGVLDWRLPGGGTLRMEAEHQRNRRPFSFGTVYVDGRYLYDQSYVAPAARSDRRYDRPGLYLERPLGATWRLDAHWSAANVRREETLAGFWSLRDATTLSGYYRELRDDADQVDIGLAVRGQIDSGAWRHHILAGWQRHALDIDFSGPQNIAGFSIDIFNPDFSGIDFGGLPLSPRISREHQRESGLYLVDRVEVSPRLHLLAGARLARLSATTDNGSIRARPTDTDHATSNWGVRYKPAAQHAIHLSRSESFQPNRGLDRFGRHLPPRTGRQYELGYRIGAIDHIGLAAYDILQDQLTAPDPLDRTALATIGAVRARGIEIDFRESIGQRLTLSGQAVLQRARNQRKTNPAHGDHIANIPGHYGALTLDWQNGGPRARRAWATLVHVGERWGNPGNTFKAPAYTRVDLGAAYHLNRASELRLVIRNLADKRYVEYLSSADNVFQGERRHVSLTFVQRW